MSKIENGKDYTVVTWDWKRGPEIWKLQEALAPFGIVVYSDPACEGTDANGAVFSDRKLSEDELYEVCDRNG